MSLPKLRAPTHSLIAIHEQSAMQAAFPLRNHWPMNKQ